MIDEKNYITIPGWMRKDLNLKGNELLIYAIIYGFSQADEQEYKGGLQYLADWCGVSKQSVITCLKKLIDKGLIRKEDKTTNNIRFCSYVCLELKKVQWYSKNFNGIQKTLTNNNIINNNINNHISNISNIDKQVTSKQVNKEPEKKVGFDFGRPKVKKQSLYSKCIDYINYKSEDPKIRELLVSWLNMLLEKYRDRDKQLYINVFKSKINMLDQFDKSEWEDIISGNLQRGYEGFYPVNRKPSIKLQNDDGVRSSRYTSEEMEELKRLEEERQRNGLRTKF